MLPFASSIVGFGSLPDALHVGTNPGETLGGIGAAFPQTPAQMGAVAGDLAIVSSSFSMSVASGSGEPWLSAGASARNSVRYKELLPTDMDTQISTGRTGRILTIYRGATTIVQIAFTTVGDTGAGTIAGAVKHPAHVGLFGFASGSPAAIITGFNQRGSATTQANGLIHTALVGDRLYPANPPYVDSTGFTYSGGDDAAGDNISIFELRLI